MRVYVHVLWMLVTALKWVTDFYTAAIIETRKAAKSKVSAANPLPLPPYLDRWLWDNSNDKAVIIGKQTSSEERNKGDQILSKTKKKTTILRQKNIYSERYTNILTRKYS